MMKISPPNLNRFNTLLVAVLAVVTAMAAVIGSLAAMSPSVDAAPRTEARASQLVPVPVQERAKAGVTFELRRDAAIYAASGATEVGDYLAGLLRPATGFGLPVRPAGGDQRAASGILLLLGGADARVGAQGYELDVTGRSVTIRAAEPAGLFAGVQTLR